MKLPIPQNNNKHSDLSIGWFVALSLLLHVLLFWGVTPRQSMVPMPAPQQAVTG